MRTVCYVQGDGLGHLTRLRAYLHTVGRADDPVTVLTGSPFAADPRVIGSYEVRTAPAGLDRGALAGWIETTLDGLRPDELIVDAFPAGRDGELRAAAIPGGTRVVHLARLLRWEAYLEVMPPAPPRFDQTWLVEPIGAEHQGYLTAISGTISALSLTDPPAPPARRPGGWLIVHAGPAAEVLDLVSYARDIAALEGLRPRLTLVAPRRPAGLPGDVAHLDVYPAWPLFGAAERIITAAGCNVVRQLAGLRDRHRMVPFPRRFDDQFARAALARAAAWPPAGRL